MVGFPANDMYKMPEDTCFYPAFFVWLAFKRGIQIFDQTILVKWAGQQKSATTWMSYKEAKVRISGL